jgi:hypothetical protein
MEGRHPIAADYRLPKSPAHFPREQAAGKLVTQRWISELQNLPGEVLKTFQLSFGIGQLILAAF